MPRDCQKRIAVINDFCGFGRCSIAVSLPIISALRVQCCPLPTAIFSNHTGYDSFYRTDYTEHMTAYSDEWKRLGLNFDGILTGFLASREQVLIVHRFLREFKNDKTITVIDPVMGDNGRLYSTYSEKLAMDMKSLVPYADVITPNLTEACILTDTEYCEDMDGEALIRICERLCDMGAGAVVISGISRGEDLENVVYERGAASVVREHKVGSCRAGTGDVFSSVIAADLVRGKSLVDSVKHASAFIAKALRRTAEMDMPREDGVCFEELLTEIERC